VRNARDQMRITYECGMKILSKIFIELTKEENLFHFIGKCSPTSGKLMQRNLPSKISKNWVLHHLVFSNKKSSKANDCHCKLLPGEPEPSECPLPGPHGSAQPTTAPQGRTWANLELLNF